MTGYVLQTQGSVKNKTLRLQCRRKQLPTPVSWPGEFHGLYSLWGHKESDTTERLSLHFKGTVNQERLGLSGVNQPPRLYSFLT